MATTLPSHVSLMTGTSTLRHGIKGNLHTFHAPFVSGEGLQTAAQIFKRMGYTTAAFVSAAPVKRDTGIAAGFDIFDEPKAAERPGGVTTRKLMQSLDSAPSGPLFL